MNKIRNFTLYFGTFLLIESFIFQYSTLINFSEMLKTLFLFAGMILLIISAFVKKNAKPFLNIILILFTILVYYYSKQTAIIELIAMILAIDEDEITSIIRFSYRILLLTLFIHIFIYILVYIYDKNLLNISIRLENNSLRHSFYFEHANVCGMLCSWTYLMYLFLNKDNLKLKHFFIGMVVVVFISQICDSRTSAMVLIITMVLLFNFNKIPRKIRNCMKQSFILIGVLSYALMVLYPYSNFIKMIDSPTALHGRIKLGYIAYKYNTAKPFGNDISRFEKINLYNEFGLNSYTIDSTYYKLYFVYGIIFTVLYYFYMYKSCKKIDDKDNVICFIFAYSLFSFMESLAVYPFIFFPILIIFSNKKTLLLETKLD